MKRVLLCLLLGLAGCDALPRDPEGTLNRVEGSKRMRVAIVTMPPDAQDEAVAFLKRLEQRTGAVVEGGFLAADAAFAALDAGTIDLAIGPFAKDTPWASLAAFGPPIAVRGSAAAPIEIKAVVRNGENRWLMLIERTARETAPEVAGR